jgi:hypothetical protein
MKLPELFLKKEDKAMKGSNDKKRRLLFFNILMLAILITVGSVNIVFAQDITEQEKQLALMQYTVPFRFNEALKVGDWVRYQIVRDGEVMEEIELEVTRQENGGVWIVEKHRAADLQMGLDMHLFVDLANKKLIKVCAIDKNGSKFEALPLDESRLSEIVEMTKQVEQTAMTDIIGWEKGAEKEKVVGVDNILECSYLEPVFSDVYREKIEGYGATVTNVKEKSRIYFSEDIPRLLPMQIAFSWVPFIETFQEIKGGFVKSAQMNLELVSYSDQKK